MFSGVFISKTHPGKQNQNIERKFEMKTKFIKALTLCMALFMCITCAVPASAAEYKDATIDVDAECSLTIWKYDWTNGATRS